MPTSDSGPAHVQRGVEATGVEPNDIELGNGERFLRFLESTPNIVGCVAGLLGVLVLAVVGLPGPIGVSAVAGIYLLGVLVTWLVLRRVRSADDEDDTPPVKPRRAAP